MSTTLNSRLPLLVLSVLVIAITSFYLANVVIPMQTHHIGVSTIRSTDNPRADTAADTVGAGLGSQAGGWSALAMTFLALPAAVGLAFAATNARLALSRAERFVWMLISIASLTLFFLTATAANMFFEDLLG